MIIIGRDHGDWGVGGKKEGGSGMGIGKGKEARIS